MITIKSDYIIKKEPRWQKNKTGNPRESQASQIVRRALFYFLSIAFLIITIYIIFFSPFLQISSVRISGTIELSSGLLQQDVENMISGRYLGFLPKNNYAITFPNLMEKKLKEKYRKIATVSIKKQFPNGLDVNLRERKSLVIWCSGEICYFVDEQGYAYLPVDFNSLDVQQNHLIRFVEEDGKEISLGQQVMDSQSVQYAVDLREKLSGIFGINQPEFFHVSSRLAEDITIDGPEELKIMVSKVIPVDKTIETLKTFEKKFGSSVRISDLEYLDVRVENKIFYKRKGQQSQENEN